MTNLLKKYEENEERFKLIIDMFCDKAISQQTFINNVENNNRFIQLAMLEGVCEMIDELNMITWRDYRDRVNRSDAPIDEVTGYEQALSDLKDKLLAEIELIKNK
jgi:hypothetical protein